MPKEYKSVYKYIKNIFEIEQIRKMTREKRIPFDVSIDPFYSKSNMDAIDESIKQLKEGKIVVKTMEELETMENE